MKTAAAAIILAATLVAAEPQHAMPSGTKVSCAKPNANYCMGGDIILRCGADGTGEPARCSDNVAGYPPAGGVSECWESSRDAGDAACQKNCVVYADKPFTIQSDKCTPTGTSTGTSSTPTGTGTTTTSVTTTSGTSSTGSHSTTPTTITTTTTTPVTTLSPPPPGTGITTGTHSGNTTVTTPSVTSSSGSTLTLTSTAGGNPTSTPPNSNNAVANGAMGSLFGLGLAVAALF